MNKKPNARKPSRPVVRPSSNEPSPEQVARNLKRVIAKAIDSGQYVVYVGWTEDGRVNFSEHKQPMPIADVLWFGKTVAEDVEREWRKSRPASETGGR